MNLVYLILIFFLTAQGNAADLHPETVSTQSSAAMKRFWKGFDNYERLKGESISQKMRQSLRDTRTAESTAVQAALVKMRKRLDNSARHYTKILESNSAGKQRASALFHLAKIRFSQAMSFPSSDGSQSTPYYEAAESLIDELVEFRPVHDERESALYLKGLLLEKKGEESLALRVWQKLYEEGRDRDGTFFGSVAWGDHWFSRDRADLATNAYRKALKLAEGLSGPDKLDIFKLQYRLVWAAYRSSELRLTVDIGSKLLQPSASLRAEKKLEIMKAEIAEIVGDALFELGSLAEERRVLSLFPNNKFLSLTGLTLILRKKNVRDLAGALQTGKTVNQFHSMTEKMPHVWNELIGLAADSNRSKQEGLYLGKLAGILMDSSLWRHRNKEKSLKGSLQLAYKAAIMLAGNLFREAHNKGLQHKFVEAAGWYRLLAEYTDRNEGKGYKSVYLDWRVKQGLSLFYGKKFRRSLEVYLTLLNSKKLDSDRLSKVLYMRVLCREELWQHELARQIELNSNLGSEPALTKSLEELQTAIEDYIGRYPDEHRSADLMLVLASAFRDSERLDLARKYWNRVVVSKSLRRQKSVALRGLVHFSLTQESPLEVVKRIDQFLALDGSDDGVLRRELLTILSRSTFSEASRLERSGELHEAGGFLLGVASRHQNVPKRSQMIRDGVYYLALGGNWAEVMKKIDRFSPVGDNSSRADVSYLRARAAEYLIDFELAATLYLEFAEKHPSHKHARKAIRRAFDMGSVDERLSTIQKSVELYGKRDDRESTKLGEMYSFLIEMLWKRELVDRSLLQSANMISALGDGVLGLRGQSYRIQSLWKAGREDKALKEAKTFLDLIASSSLTGKAKGELSSPILHLVLNDQIDAFDDYVVLERSGSRESRLERKRQLFQELALTSSSLMQSGGSFESEARYLYASAAARYSSELQAIGEDWGQSETLRSAVSRLKSLSRKLHGENVLLPNRDGRWTGDRWVLQSAASLPVAEGQLIGSNFEEIHVGPYLPVEMWSYQR